MSGTRAPAPAGPDASPLAERIETRLERLSLSAGEATARAGLPPEAIGRILSGRAPAPRGEALRKLADVLECSVAYLVGLDPDAEPPPELLREDQGSLGLLSGDQEALLRAYRRLDVASRAALLRVALKMAGPEPDAPTKPRRAGRRAG